MNPHISKLRISIAYTDEAGVTHTRDIINWDDVGFDIKADFKLGLLDLDSNKVTIGPNPVSVGTELLMSATRRPT